jgi:hypothetical protein
MQEFDKERPLATVHVNAMHGFYFREKPNYLATVLVVAMHNLFFFLFFDLQPQIVIDIFLLCNLVNLSWVCPSYFCSSFFFINIHLNFFKKKV